MFEVCGARGVVIEDAPQGVRVDFVAVVVLTGPHVPDGCQRTRFRVAHGRAGEVFGVEEAGAVFRLEDLGVGEVLTPKLVCF